MYGHIKALTITIGGWLARELEIINTLTQLESLVVRNSFLNYSNKDIHRFSDLRKVTKLLVCTRACGIPLESCSSLVELCLHECHLCADHVQTLPFFSKLRLFDLKEKLDIPSFILECWKELKVLKISITSVDNDFFPTMAHFRNWNISNSTWRIVKRCEMNSSRPSNLCFHSKLWFSVSEIRSFDSSNL